MTSAAKSACGDAGWRDRERGGGVALLAELIERAVQPERSLLIVIDGAKAAGLSGRRDESNLATPDPRRAPRLLDNLTHPLGHRHPGAAASLRESLDAILTVMLGLAENLEQVLSSTNLIGNLFSRMREMKIIFWNYQQGIR